MKASVDQLGTFFGISIGYVTLFYISDILAGTQAVAGFASVFFLPAFVRLLGFLLIGMWVAPALLLAGTFLVLAGSYDLGSGAKAEIIVTLVTAFSGPLGAATVARFAALKPNLENLSPIRLLVLSIGCSGANTIGYSLTLELLGLSHHESYVFWSIFIGDMIGTWVIIYTIKLIIDLYRASQRHI